MSKTLSVLITILAVVVLAGIGYYFLNQNFQNQKDDLQAQITDLQSQAKTSGSSASAPALVDQGDGITVLETKEAKAICKSLYPELTYVSEIKDSMAANCGINRIYGDYAKGLSGSQGAGANWLAIKTNNKWKIKTISQADWFCNELQKYNFPSGILGKDSDGKCYNETTNKLELY